MRTSNIFAVIMKRFEASIKANIEILKRYGVKLFLYSMVSSLFSEVIPIVGTLSYAGYEFVTLGSMTASNFSVVMSSITSVSIATIDTSIVYSSAISGSYGCSRNIFKHYYTRQAAGNILYRKRITK